LEATLFVQHKQLKSLNVAAEKIAHLHASSSCVQLAFAGFPPQLCSAYLLQVSGASKTLIVVAFYLMESQRSIFFVPKFGEVEKVDAEKIYEEGHSFVESMGFILTETDYHLLSAERKKPYWDVLPICQAPKPEQKKPLNKSYGGPDSDPAREKELKALSACSLESLGRFLASM
jgi:hypothetical protein